MPIELTPEAPVYQCRHIFTDGHRCGSRSLRGEYFCYYHHQTRRPVENLRERRGHQSTPTSAFTLPLPEDRSAIQSAIGQVIQRLAANELDPRRAGLLLYALQIASSNLPKADKNAQPVETVGEITLDETHGFIAPESELKKAPGEKSLETILLEQWAKDDELAAQPETVDIEASAEIGCPRFRRAPHRVDPGVTPSAPARPKSRPNRRLLNTLDTLGGRGVSPTRLHQNRVPALVLAS